MPETPPLLKDMIDRQSVRTLSRAIASNTQFDEAAFLEAVFDRSWEGLALKQRIRHIVSVLRDFLPAPYEHALDVLLAAAPAVGEAGMTAWVLCDFVEVYGVEDPDRSIPALERFTKVISAEFAVRPFLIRYPERMIAQQLTWAASPDASVRRLASEGSRPRLPWGMAVRHLRDDPTPILPILDRLKHDESEDVRRSVANNLNDISKDHPDLLVEILAGWQDPSPEMAQLIRHALRTLLKKGHPGAMGLLGYATDVSIKLVSLQVDPSRPRVGEHTTLTWMGQSTAETIQSLMIDYAVTYQNISGTGSRKVFKGVTTDLTPGGSVDLIRKISLAQRTTRRILPGAHRVEVLVNGMVVGAVDFVVDAHRDNIIGDDRSPS